MIKLCHQENLHPDRRKHFNKKLIKGDPCPKKSGKLNSPLFFFVGMGGVFDLFTINTCYHRCIESNYKSLATCRPIPAADVVVNSYVFNSEVFLPSAKTIHMMFLKSFEVQIHFWGHVANPLLVALPALAQTALKSEAGGGGPEKENRDCWLKQCERQKDPLVWLTGPFLRAVVTALHVTQHIHILTWFCVKLLLPI